MFDDKEFLLKEMGEVCCLRRVVGGIPEHGFVTRGNVREVNLGDWMYGGTGEVKQYESVDAMLADGWRVD